MGLCFIWQNGRNERLSGLHGRQTKATKKYSESKTGRLAQLSIEQWKKTATVQKHRQNRAVSKRSDREISNPER
jgi:hypothetical protein